MAPYWTVRPIVSQSFLYSSRSAGRATIEANVRLALRPWREKRVESANCRPKWSLLVPIFGRPIARTCFAGRARALALERVARRARAATCEAQQVGRRSCRPHSAWWAARKRTSSWLAVRCFSLAQVQQADSVSRGQASSEGQPTQSAANCANGTTVLPNQSIAICCWPRVAPAARSQEQRARAAKAKREDHHSA